MNISLAFFYLLLLLAVFLNGCCAHAKDEGANPATGRAAIWQLRAASLYQRTTADKAATSSKQSLSSEEGEYLTAQCVLNDPMDVYNADFKAKLSAGTPASDLFRESEQVIPLYEHLWGPKADESRVASVGSGSGSSVIAGTLTFGPINGELAQSSTRDPSVIATVDEQDETDENFALSVFLGESTDKLCFDVSLYRRMEDVGVLTKAIMTWTSSSYTSSCQLRLSSYMENELNLSTPVYYYSQKMNAVGMSYGKLSPWLAACKLATVDRFTYVFVPSTVLASDSFCHYLDEEPGAPPLMTGMRRQVNCSVVLAVQFRSAASTIHEAEKRLAMLKVAASLTLSPVRRDRTSEDNNITKAQVQRDSGSGWFASNSAEAASREGDSSSDENCRGCSTDHSSSSSSSSSNGDAFVSAGHSLATAMCESTAAPHHPTNSQTPLKMDDSSEATSEKLGIARALYMFTQQVNVRCTQPSLSASFWNVSGSLCSPEGVIVPEDAVVGEPDSSEEWVTVALLVISSVCAAVLAFFISRFALVYLSRRPRGYRR